MIIHVHVHCTMFYIIFISRECIGEPVTKKDLESFQNRVYSFLQLVKPHQEGKKRLLAMDISFNGLGCTYILEWAIESVIRHPIVHTCIIFFMFYMYRFALLVSIHISTISRSLSKMTCSTIKLRYFVYHKTFSHYQEQIKQRYTQHSENKYHAYTTKYIRI